MESVIASREEVESFLFVQQIISNFDFRLKGYAHGCGTFQGYGSGYGSGCGSGESDGYGYCYDYYYNDSNGSGSGNGFGSSNGSGSSCSNGYGNGNEDIKALNGNIVDYIDSVPTIIIQVKGNFAKGYIIDEDNLTFESCYVAKVGNSFAHGKTLKEAVADAKEKEIEKMPIEERIEEFKDVFGSLDSEHTGKEFYDWHHILTGSCRMGRDGFCKTHKIDLEKKYTVRYFLDITKDSYGSDIIELVCNAYGLSEEKCANVTDLEYRRVNGFERGMC